MMDKPKIEAESKKEGTVSLKTYLNYFARGGSAITVVCLFIIHVLCQSFYTISDVWVGVW